VEYVLSVALLREVVKERAEFPPPGGKILPSIFLNSGKCFPPTSEDFFPMEGEFMGNSPEQTVSLSAHRLLL
jgi:hypothetical protein